MSGVAPFFTRAEKHKPAAREQSSKVSLSEDIGVHQLERLVELLTSSECEDLLFTLSHPEENIFRHLERLSPERNRLDLKPRAKRDASSEKDSEVQCRTALTDWLLKYGEQTYYDRLSRALQHIGRTDIAMEVGKNINQDKLLNLKRYVEEYHKYASSLNVPPIQSDSKNKKQKVKKRKGLDYSNMGVTEEEEDQEQEQGQSQTAPQHTRPPFARLH
ncbi:transmembrane and death domain protein 1-like isoform X2 [Xyrichtys novacula]|uniref:Transmembrane and death domain protein 1-like isoform X2 n=1 Tax=Xyrichtys novacula TaxID=13765 RepID=A0AAV1HG46_XYRNO|nr:transmembrane and death domain protein 1-like isoform X2 [Xyrichtys novacula]